MYVYLDRLGVFDDGLALIVVGGDEDIWSVQGGELVLGGRAGV